MTPMGLARSGQVTLIFPCLKLQPRKCKITRISEVSKSEPVQKSLKPNSSVFLSSFFLPAALEKKLSKHSDSLPTSYVSAPKP